MWSLVVVIAPGTPSRNERIGPAGKGLITKVHSLGQAGYPLPVAVTVRPNHETMHQRASSLLVVGLHLSIRLSRNKCKGQSSAQADISDMFGDK
jgi:hypothetical protein